MESMNVLKGYDKVDINLETQNPHSHRSNKSRKRLITTLTISAIIILALIISLLLATLTHKSHNEQRPESNSSTNSVDSLKTVCNVTQHPDSCFTSISSLDSSTKPDPEYIFKLSLQVSSNELTNISTLLKTLNDANSQAAINDCFDLFDDALKNLNDSILAVDGEKKALTLENMNDIRTWISAAMTDQQTCVDGLEEMGSSVVDQVKAKTVNSNEFLSNSLAIIANMENLFQKFNLKLH